MESSVATTASSSTTPPTVVLTAGDYEVFMSFRGSDVRNRFADHLYTSLTRAKIRTFRDEEELQKGEGITPSLIRAIPESKIYIPILSERYASSKWCLLELAQMVDCWKQGKGYLILPIFYLVDPKDVRHQQGPYQQAFEEHAHKHSSQNVNAWKEALNEVGQLKGWHITESRGEGTVVGEVLSKVESHLGSMYTLATDELVGIDTPMEEVMKLLNLGSSNEKVIVGIHGMGGIGKTTLSKAVYNKIFVKFDRCCYLEDVREALAKSDGAVSLQNKVISTVLKVDRLVRSVSEGTNVIKDRVCKHKLLLVIDDIDDKFEFDKILGKLDDFSSDSRFIFTTRYRRALDFIPDCKLYEPGEMSSHISLQLFSKYAFGMDHPPEEVAGISEEFVKVATGLPLALKVIGSLLFRREKKFWEEKLIELQGIPSTTENMVQERLKISYNDLSHNEKQIFLDIACFFIGSHKDLPYYMWSGCNFYPESGISTLIHRSLIKLDEANLFWMHDHIKDLGRAIVKEEDVRHTYNRSRIWSTDDVLDMLRNSEGSERVEVVRIDVKSRDDHDRVLKSKKFEKLSGLRYLEVQYGRMMGDFSQVLPNICCLRLCHCESIPTNINAKKLVVLDLQHSNIKDDWKGWSRIKTAAKLKAVNVQSCLELKTTPDLSTCTSLEFITFTRCYNMKGQMQIDKFKNMKTLRIYKTRITELVVRSGDIGKFQRLEEMDVSWTDLRELPAGMEILSSLKILSLGSPQWRTNSLMVIPMLPRSLKRLSIVSSSSAALPTSLTSLHVVYCQQLNELPSLANLSNLTHLTISEVGVAEIRGLGELRALETMEIGSRNLNNLDGLENLLLLRTLTLRSAKLERLPSLANLRNLKDLEVSYCPYIIEIQGLGSLGESLSRMTIKKCPSLANLDGLQLLEALEEFTFDEHSFGRKSSLDLSGRLHKLKRLNILRCPELTEVKGLERLVSLEWLTMEGCGSIRRLPDLSELNNLKRLLLSECWSIAELPNLSCLNNLEELDIVGCRELVEVNGLDELEKLGKLKMGRRMRVKCFAKLAARYGKRLSCTSLWVNGKDYETRGKKAE
ncbi:unnamed protein product [Linum tenue]|uniref:TIR domain-containing protein n=1 Tax=Linum tenue TaxID=586396 RepID=A0AAV0N1K2_9ROSI|nr:unnamed protein product [Linum tenue]